MENASVSEVRAADGLAERLEQIRRFSGPPNEFWSSFLKECSQLIGAGLGLLLLRGEEGEPWRKLALWPATGEANAAIARLDPRILAVADAAVQQGVAFEQRGGDRDAPREGDLVGVRLRIGDERPCAAVFLIGGGAGLAAGEMAVRLTLLADTPAVYQLGLVASRAKSDLVRFAEALDLMTLLNAENRYLAAAMTFCNELASRYRCDRVSLGWLKGGYVRVQAISHMERFEKKMAVVQSLEAAMEEALDQDEEIVYPKPDGNLAVIRDHEAFSREQDSRYICSLTIRLDDRPEGVVTCERSAAPFSEEEVRGIRVLCDQAARRLADLRRRDRWIGARAATALGESLSRLLGHEHTLLKATAVVLVVLVAFLLFGTLHYRIEAPFALKTDDLAFLPSPFDGYIQKVHVKIGDPVRKGDLLLSLDTRELRIEESGAEANRSRYGREAAKARSQGALADMKVALALQEQAKARLDLVRYQLAHAELKAPFDGVVVEGDLKELLGAPVKKGDILFKVALIEKMYAELKVNERDVHEVTPKAAAEIAFLGRPDLTFPVTLERIDPVAVTQEMENVYLVRAHFPDAVSPWWRPGMSGVAKIDVGRRNVLWILTHRTVDFLRIFFWW